MTDTVHIEPGRPHRPAFAAWGLSQDPALHTASASGWDVPLDLYPSVPTELLEGGYVDGFPYGGPGVPQPVREAAGGPMEAVLDVTMDSGPLPTRKSPTGAVTRKEPAARKRATRREPVSTGPTGSDVDEALATVHPVLMIDDFGGTES